MNLDENFKKIKEQISQEEAKAFRKPGSVMLLAVSKQQPFETILEAYRLGQRHFAENYFQEAQEKIKQLSNLPLHWHFIGPIQGNKAKGIAKLFDWVHSINRPDIAAALSRHRGREKPPLQVCLQINLIEEKTKAGISPNEAFELAGFVHSLPSLQLRGLMTIPPPLEKNEDRYALFIQLKQCLENINQRLEIKMDTLSMGMSDDFVPAIRAGSTMLRIGRALFGERT